MASGRHAWLPPGSDDPSSVRRPDGAVTPLSTPPPDEVKRAGSGASLPAPGSGLWPRRRRRPPDRQDDPVELGDADDRPGNPVGNLAVREDDEIEAGPSGPLEVGVEGRDGLDREFLSTGRESDEVRVLPSRHDDRRLAVEAPAILQIGFAVSRAPEPTPLGGVGGRPARVELERLADDEQVAR